MYIVYCYTKPHWFDSIHSSARRRRMLRSLECCALYGPLQSILFRQQNTTNVLIQTTDTISPRGPNLHQNLRYRVLHRPDPVQVASAPEPQRYLNSSKQPKA